MSYILRFLPELEEDVMAAHDWYEDKAAGLGAEFLRSFYAHVATLQRTPLIYPKVCRTSVAVCCGAFRMHVTTVLPESLSSFMAHSIAPAIQPR